MDARPSAPGSAKDSLLSASDREDTSANSAYGSGVLEEGEISDVESVGCRFPIEGNKGAEKNLGFEGYIRFMTKVYFEGPDLDVSEYSDDELAILRRILAPGNHAIESRRRRKLSIPRIGGDNVCLPQRDAWEPFTFFRVAQTFLKANPKVSFDDPNVIASPAGPLIQKEYPFMATTIPGGKLCGVICHRYSKRGMSALPDFKRVSGVFVPLLKEGSKVKRKLSDPLPLFFESFGGGSLDPVGLQDETVMEMIEYAVCDISELEPMNIRLTPESIPVFLQQLEDVRRKASYRMYDAEKSRAVEARDQTNQQSRAESPSLACPANGGVVQATVKEVRELFPYKKKESAANSSSPSSDRVKSNRAGKVLSGHDDNGAVSHSHGVEVMIKDRHISLRREHAESTVKTPNGLAWRLLWHVATKVWRVSRLEERVPTRCRRPGEPRT